MKVCKKCGKNKPLKDFYKNTSLKDGYENSCKVCRRNQRKKFKVRCINCGVNFNATIKNSKYCSPKCKPQSQKNRIEVSCYICGKRKEITPSRKKSHKHFYCSDECKNKGYSNLYSGKNHARYSSVLIKCYVCEKEFERWESQVLKYERNYCSVRCRQQDFRKRFLSENNPNWDRNKKEEERILNRNIEGYSEWRLKTFERDSFSCQCCGDSRGGNLVAHHIFNYSEYPNLRTCLNNSITLCVICHKSFHDLYGYRGNNRCQLDEFIENFNNNKHANTEPSPRGNVGKV